MVLVYLDVPVWCTALVRTHTTAYCSGNKTTANVGESNTVYTWPIQG